jgi:putative DNA primase/helicase
VGEQTAEVELAEATIPGPQPESPTLTAGKGDDEFTDARMAETIAKDVLSGRFIWTGGLGWLTWDGRRWQQCSDVTVTEAVRQYCVDKYTAVVANGSGFSDAGKGWHSMLRATRERTVIGLARGLVERRAAQFDAHPDLLNCPNGVVDLRTGKLRKHDPELLFTKVTSAAYQPDAKHEDWDAALRAIPDGIRDWMQVRYGQAITGYMTPDDVMLVQQGSGENGKTTFTTGITSALGDYYVLVSDRVILATPSNHPTELMELRGARLALIEETPKARQLDTQRLKKTVGTPEIEARHTYKDSVRWRATHSLFLNTNYELFVEETDWGTWRRLALVKFPYTFRKTREQCIGPLHRLGDTNLRYRLERGSDGRHEAVLAWLVEGAVKWYAADRMMPEMPESVAEGTRDWRKKSDLVLAYIDDRIDFNAQSHVTAEDLADDVNNWLSEHDQAEWDARTVASRFGEHGEVADRGVRKKRVRSGRAGLSRPYGLPHEPSQLQYTAWLGMGFKESVQGVHGTSELSANTPIEKSSETPYSPCTLDSEDKASPARASRSPSMSFDFPATTPDERTVTGRDWGVCSTCNRRHYNPDGNCSRVAA